MDPTQVFEQALRHVFAGWTVLNLAVDQGWGGRSSAAKRDELFQTILDAFYTQKNDVVGSVDRLAGFLSQQMEMRFRVDCEDDTEFVEIATILTQLAKTLRSGDFSYAESILQRQHADNVANSRPMGDDSSYGIDPQNSLYGGQQRPPYGNDDGDDDDDDSSSGYADDDEVIAAALAISHP